MRSATGVLVLAALLAVAGGSLTAGTATASSAWRREPRRTMAAYEWHNPGDLPIAEVRRRLRFLRHTASPPSTWSSATTWRPPTSRRAGPSS
jgi:hypothetical protein